jgi:hypothetical protein
MNNNMTTKPQDQRDIEAREALNAEWKEFQNWFTFNATAECGRTSAWEGWHARAERARPAPEALTLCGMPVVTDPSLAPGEFEIRSGAAPEALGAAIPGDVETAVRMAFESTNETQYTPLCKYWFRKGYGYGLEALGAAKGELSDAEIREKWIGRLGYAITAPELEVVQSILAKTKGEQA